MAPREILPEVFIDKVYFALSFLCSFDRADLGGLKLASEKDVRSTADLHRFITDSVRKVFEQCLNKNVKNGEK